jgi:hypothetical protein
VKGRERAGRTGTSASLYESQEDFSKAIEHHSQDLAIAKEVGDRAGEGRAPCPLTLALATCT